MSKTPASTIAKNGLVKSSKVIDYANIKWPRDALYIPYTYPGQFLDDKNDEKELSYKVKYTHFDIFKGIIIDLFHFMNNNFGNEYTESI